jgi:hypothetical protein
MFLIVIFITFGEILVIILLNRFSTLYVIFYFLHSYLVSYITDFLASLLFYCPFLSFNFRLKNYNIPLCPLILISNSINMLLTSSHKFSSFWYISFNCITELWWQHNVEMTHEKIYKKYHHDLRRLLHQLVTFPKYGVHYQNIKL